MSRQKIQAIEYIRGISMLGVIGIHTGAYSLSNPHVNVHLFALLEIFTRFSVPIFFFISAFGLFLHQDLRTKLDYVNFTARRSKTVLIPYITWSILYMLHYTLVSHDILIWKPPLVFDYFIFGLGSYQLYFLVILMWFYLLMPLWRPLVRFIIKYPIRNLSILLVLQILFNYYSSYMFSISVSNPFLNKALNHRLNYWVAHYLFIFLFGAVCAVEYPKFQLIITKYKKHITNFFYITLAGMLIFYYYLLYVLGYTPEQAVSTDHQLSPIGVLYTLSASLFYFMWFTLHKLPNSLNNILSNLGKHSYTVYLFHPFAMYYLAIYLTKHNQLMTVVNTIAFYILTVVISLAFAIVIKKVSTFIPLFGLLLTGVKPPKQKSGI